MIRKPTVNKAIIYSRMIGRNLLITMYGLSQKIDVKFMFAKMEYLPCQVGYIVKPFMLVLGLDRYAFMASVFNKQ
jgi:hypothetical protein